MNRKTAFIIALLFYLIMPVLVGYVIAKLFVNHNGKALTIIFVVLIILEILAVIYKIIKYKNSKK